MGATPELVAGSIPDEAFDPVAGDDRSIAAAVKQRNRQERASQLSFGSDETTWSEDQPAMASAVRAIHDLPADTVGQVREQRAAYAAYQMGTVDPRRTPLDAWTAAFFWPLTRSASSPPTTADLRSMSARLSAAQRQDVAALRATHRFFHWPLEFPEVFEHGGFDCVLGNPPWERIKLQEQEFFAERDAAIAEAANKAARQRLIEMLPRTNPPLAQAFADAKRAAEGQSKFVRASDRFPRQRQWSIPQRPRDGEIAFVRSEAVPPVQSPVGDLRARRGTRHHPRSAG